MKFKVGRSRLTIAALVIVVIVAVAGAYSLTMMNGQVGLVYSEVKISSTVAGSACRFSVLWRNDANVSGYIFGTNNTGVFQNDTWTPFTNYLNSTSAFSITTRNLNGTIGNIVEWIVWCNDTNGNWRSTGLQTICADSNLVLLMTTMGNITIALYEDMPITTANFKDLVRRGVYNGVIFHRVAKDLDSGFWIIQTGDPTGTGLGDPSIPAIRDEFTDHNRNERGTVAMANKGPNTGSSQFFVNLNNNTSLDASLTYPVFGRVIEGMDVAVAIGDVVTDPAGDGKPVQIVKILVAKFV